MHRVTPRILMILENESFPEDTRVYLEAGALTEAGFDVTVICPAGVRRKTSERVEGVQVYRYPKPWEIGGFVGYLLEYSYSMLMAMLLSLWVLLRRGFDAVHIHVPPDVNVLIGILYQWMGKKLIVDMHDLSPELYQAQRDEQGSRLVYRTLLWFERLACRRADRLIATNQSQRKVQLDRCDVSESKCHIIRNGPNELFDGDAEPREDVSQIAPNILGYVGMIGHQDGVMLLIDAVERLSQNRTDFVAMIVGHGPALGSLRRSVKNRKLDPYVRFTGLVPYEEVPSYIASFDVCITPDPSNAYNDSCTTIKTMEYMALGKPTVAFDTSENEFTAGPAALYAANNDLDEFTRLVNELLDSPERRQEMGRFGRQRVQEVLHWKHQRQGLITLYQDLFQFLPSEARDAVNNEQKPACENIVV